MARKRPHAEVKPPESPSNTPKLAPSLASGTAERLSITTVRSAVDALLKDYAKHERKRARRAVAQGKAGPIVDEESFVTLGLTLKQPPFKDRLRPDAIRLKHSLVMDDDEVLLIVKDPQRLVKDYLAEHGNGGVTRVLGVDKVHKRYGTHEGRRELLKQYDHFLVDRRVAPMMPNLLGKPFIAAKRMPLSVNMEGDVVSCIERTLCSTALFLRRGTSISIRVAHMEFEAEEIVENIVGAMEGVVTKVAGGWDGVQSLMIKSNKSPALPIYLAKPGWVDTMAGKCVKQTAEKSNDMKGKSEEGEADYENNEEEETVQVTIERKAGAKKRNKKDKK